MKSVGGNRLRMPAVYASSSDSTSGLARPSTTAVDSRARSRGVTTDCHAAPGPTSATRGSRTNPHLVQYQRRFVGAPGSNSGISSSPIQAHRCASRTPGCVVEIRIQARGQWSLRARNRYLSPVTTTPCGGPVSARPSLTSISISAPTSSRYTTVVGAVKTTSTTRTLPPSTLNGVRAHQKGWRRSRSCFHTIRSVAAEMNTLRVAIAMFTHSMSRCYRTDLTGHRAVSATAWRRYRSARRRIHPIDESDPA